MKKSKARDNKSKVTQRQRSGNSGWNASQRTDYHDNYESASSNEDTDDLLVYEWSKVITIYQQEESELEVF